MTIEGDLLGMKPSPIIELFTLQLDSEIHNSNTLYRFHAGVQAKTSRQNVVWRGNEYTALPVEVTGFEWTGKGLPKPRLKLSNIAGFGSTVLALINADVPGNDLTGATFRRIRTLAAYLDAVNFQANTNPYGTPAHVSFEDEVYTVDRLVLQSREACEWELASVFDLSEVAAPRRQVLADRCQWSYRRHDGSNFVYTKATCPYTGSACFDEDDGSTSAENDKCGKTIDSCKARFGNNAVLPFGAFPGIGMNTQ